MSDARVIGLVGLKQHGKDTAADILVKDKGYVKAAFAERLKTICMENFSLTYEQVYGDEKETPDPRWVDKNGEPRTARFILQWLGTQGFRTVDPDFWVKYFFANIYEEGLQYVVCDVRFPNELDAIMEQGGRIWVVDMPQKPVEQNRWRQFKDWLFRRGAFHASEKMARALVTQGRRGELDPGQVYVPFVWGQPGDNRTIVLKAFEETLRTYVDVPQVRPLRSVK